MKTYRNLLAVFEIGALVLTGGILRADTIYGPGTITISTNEAIVINACSGGALLYIDGQAIGTFAEGGTSLNPHFAIAGPHTLTMTTNIYSGQAGAFGNGVYITFQRVKTSAIHTIIVPTNETQVVNVPQGKTIQFYDPLGSAGVTISAQAANMAINLSVPLNSGMPGYTHPAVTGPITVAISSQSIYGGSPNLHPAVISYYFVTKPKALPPVDLIN